MASCLPPLVLASFSSLIHHDEERFRLRKVAPRGAAGRHHSAPAARSRADRCGAVRVVRRIRIGRPGSWPQRPRCARRGASGRRRIGPPGTRSRRRIALPVGLFRSRGSPGFRMEQGSQCRADRQQCEPSGVAASRIDGDRRRARESPPRSSPEHGPGARPRSAQDREILGRVDRLLVEQKLFRDENLTLARLARRAGVPARQISGAINRLARKNVSQYINDCRIGEACRLLRETDMSVTAAMFDSGFQTKSNFNREFRRVTSLSPASWREKSRPSQAPRYYKLSRRAIDRRAKLSDEFICALLPFEACPQSRRHRAGNVSQATGPCRRVWWFRYRMAGLVGG